MLGAGPQQGPSVSGASCSRCGRMCTAGKNDEECNEAASFCFSVWGAKVSS